MSKGEVDLASVFQSVTQALSENQQNLNAADGYNGDHGTNMVQTFQTITAALEKKQGSSDSAALNYAAKQLSKKASSGSAKLYSEHLNRAASQLKGKTVDSRGALDLLQMLIGGGQQEQQPSSGGGDLLGSLLGGLGGGQQEPEQSEQSSGGGDLLGALLGGMGGGQHQQQQSSGGGDLLGALLGGLGGGQQQQQSSGGGDLLGALLGGLGGGQQQQQSSGGGDLIGKLLGALISSGALTSLVQSFLGGSKMGDAAHRTQSTEVVVQSYLQALQAQSGQPE